MGERQRPNKTRRRAGGEAARSLALVGAIVAGSLGIAALSPEWQGEEALAPVFDPAAVTSHVSHAAEASPASEPPAVLPAQDHPAPAGDERALVARPLLPDLRVLEPSGLHIVDQTDGGGDRRLKFTTTIWNAGPGPLEVRGHEDADSGELSVYQTFHTRAGDVVEGGPVGTFQFDHRHGHLHLAAFARYELWSLTEGGEKDELVAENAKVGFCLMDNVVVDEDLVDETKGVYPVNCRGEIQGISPGYGDVYAAQLYEQDLVIDGLPDGRYALVNIANPAGEIAELRTDNNRAVAHVRIAGRSAWVD